MKIKAKVIDQIRDNKIIVFKKKRRHNYRRKIGHRQDLTLVKIEEIITSSSSNKKPKEESNPRKRYQMAHKKAGGSTRNGRDSAGRRLGIKKFGGEKGDSWKYYFKTKGNKVSPWKKCFNWEGSYNFCHH